MTILQRIRQAPGKYRSEIGLTILSAVVGVALGKVADPILGAPLFDQIQLGVLCAATAFLVGGAIPTD